MCSLSPLLSLSYSLSANVNVIVVAVYFMFLQFTPSITLPLLLLKKGRRERVWHSRPAYTPTLPPYTLESLIIPFIHLLSPFLLTLCLSHSPSSPFYLYFLRLSAVTEERQQKCSTIQATTIQQQTSTKINNAICMRERRPMSHLSLSSHPFSLYLVPSFLFGSLSLFLFPFPFFFSCLFCSSTLHLPSSLLFIYYSLCLPYPLTLLPLALHSHFRFSFLFSLFSSLSSFSSLTLFSTIPFFVHSFSLLLPPSLSFYLPLSLSSLSPIPCICFFSDIFHVFLHTHENCCSSIDPILQPYSCS